MLEEDNAWETVSKYCALAIDSSTGRIKHAVILQIAQSILDEKSRAAQDALIGALNKMSASRTGQMPSVASKVQNIVSDLREDETDGNLAGAQPPAAFAQPLPQPVKPAAPVAPAVAPAPAKPAVVPAAAHTRSTDEKFNDALRAAGKDPDEAILFGARILGTRNNYAYDKVRVILSAAPDPAKPGDAEIRNGAQAIWNAMIEITRSKRNPAEVERDAMARINARGVDALPQQAAPLAQPARPAAPPAPQPAPQRAAPASPAPQTSAFATPRDEIVSLLKRFKAEPQNGNAIVLEFNKMVANDARIARELVALLEFEMKVEGPVFKNELGFVVAALDFLPKVARDSQKERTVVGDWAKDAIIKLARNEALLPKPIGTRVDAALVDVLNEDELTKAFNDG